MTTLDEPSRDDVRKPQLPPGVTAAEIVGIAARHGAHNVRVFGSRARGTATPESDLDLLVDIASGRDLFDLIDLKHEIEATTGRRVDVLTEKALSPYLRDDVLREALAL